MQRGLVVSESFDQVAFEYARRQELGTWFCVRCRRSEWTEGDDPLAHVPPMLEGHDGERGPVCPGCLTARERDKALAELT
jgi:hypothetical protein